MAKVPLKMTRAQGYLHDKKQLPMTSWTPSTVTVSRFRLSTPRLSNRQWKVHDWGRGFSQFDPSPSYLCLEPLNIKHSCDINPIMVPNRDMNINGDINPIIIKYQTRWNHIHGINQAWYPMKYQHSSPSITKQQITTHQQSDPSPVNISHICFKKPIYQFINMIYILWILNLSIYQYDLYIMNYKFINLSIWSIYYKL